MKKTKLFLLLLSGFISTSLCSQICSSVGSGNNNSLDWENSSTFVFYLSSNNGAPSYISNPFFASGTTCNNNISPFCNPPSPNNDISSSDGWRYVSHDFGQSNNTIECPVFILYNIYSGMLRVFFYKSLTTPSNSAIVALDYKSGAKRTALLEHYGGSVRKAVQVFDNYNKSILIPNTYVLSPSWSHADFITQYDPCTCQSTSAYELKLVSTLNSTVSFTVNGQVNQEIKANQNGGNTQALTVKNASTGLTTIGNVIGIGNGTNPTATQYNNTFNAVSGFFNNIGKVLSVVDFFVGLFSKQPAPPKVTPLVFNVNLSGNGSISTDLTLQKAPLNNPGSNLSNVSIANRPVFNNIMGTFSIISTPQIRYKRYINQTSCYYNYNSYTDDWYQVCDEEHSGQLELVGDIKWVLNPDAQLSVSELVASYVVEGPNGERFETQHFPLDCFKSYKPVVSIGIGMMNELYGNTIPNYQNVFLKISGSFAAPNNQELVFTALYNTNFQDLNNNSYSTPSEILPFAGCSAITPSASFSEIQAVCNSPQYISRRDQFYKSPTNNDNTDFTLKSNTKNNIEMAVSPNPASNNVNLRYSVKTQSNIKIGIYDLAGKMIKDIKNEKNVAEGYYDFSIDLANISSGLYTIVLESNGEKIVKKLSVLQK
jgi:hypothetical protein